MIATPQALDVAGKQPSDGHTRSRGVSGCSAARAEGRRWHCLLCSFWLDSDGFRRPCARRLLVASLRRCQSRGHGVGWGSLKRPGPAWEPPVPNSAQASRATACSPCHPVPLTLRREP